MFVDLHLHLLPGVDDGCQTLADSLSMARTLVKLGVSHAAPSPHNRPEYATKAQCVAVLQALREQLQKEGVPLALDVNAENFFLDDTLLQKAHTDEGRRVGTAGKYLLVEAPYTNPLPALNDVIFRLKVKGVTPLIAHPERCVEFEKKGRAAELVQAGAHLQMDIGALIGRYGRTAQKLAKQFLDDGLYSIVATDLHSPVGAEQWVSQSMEAVRKQAGAKALELLFGTNPAAILRGDAL